MEAALAEYSSVEVLAKAIENVAEDARGDSCLAGMARRAKAVRASFERGKTDSARALEQLFEEIALNNRRERNQSTRGGRQWTGKSYCQS